MKPGRKPADRALKLARGTYRAERDAGAAAPAPGTVPLEPGSLTDAGRSIWLDIIGYVVSAGRASEADAMLLAVMCNLAGAINSAWDSGSVPPITAVSELRRLAEVFGLAGNASRLTPAAPAGENPFAINGRR